MCYGKVYSVVPSSYKIHTHFDSISSSVSFCQFQNDKSSNLSKAHDLHVVTGTSTGPITAVVLIHDIETRTGSNGSSQFPLCLKFLFLPNNTLNTYTSFLTTVRGVNHKRATTLQTIAFKQDFKIKQEGDGTFAYFKGCAGGRKWNSHRGVKQIWKRDEGRAFHFFHFFHFIFGREDCCCLDSHLK